MAASVMAAEKVGFVKKYSDVMIAVGILMVSTLARLWAVWKIRK